jgi:hypothetical protein
LKVIPFKIVPLGSYPATEALFPLLIAVLEGFFWNTFQLVGYALLDIIPLAPELFLKFLHTLYLKCE